MEAHQPMTPESAPDSPASVSVTSISQQAGSPITSIDVAWEPPSNATGDGGSPITSYKIEWYTAEAVCEKQLLRLTWDEDDEPGTHAGYVLQFSNGLVSAPHGVTTSNIEYDSTASRVRDGLMNLGYVQNQPYDSEYVVGNIEVKRTSTNNFNGYSWTITFVDCEAGGLNEGNLVPINAPSESISDALDLDIIELQTGSRSLGQAEEQIVRIYGTRTANETEMPVRGFWRLGFDGSQYSIYMPSDATSAQVEESLELLDTVAQIVVSVSTYEPNDQMLGLEWRITFQTDVGDQPVLYGDGANLYSSIAEGSVTMEIVDGDNAIDDSTGLKLDTTIVGEVPARYGSAIVGADDRDYTISGLESGIDYFIRVSAINVHGAGPVKSAGADAFNVPQQIPDPPTNVSLAVNYGDDDSLTISFNAPVSDGGASITHYRVELDPTDTFDNPIRQDIYCPFASLKSVWRISTSTADTDDTTNPLIGGSFQLELSVDGNSYTTDPIAYNAVASASDEVEIDDEIPIAGTNSRTFTVTNNSAVVRASASLAGILFHNDIIRIDNQNYEGARYRVSMETPSSLEFNLTDPDEGTLRPFVGTTSSTAGITRVYGGRGTAGTSLVFCESTSSYCTSVQGRLQSAGSVESKIEALSEAITLGVNVSRFGPDETNSFIWFVTFLDDSPVSEALDFTLTLANNELKDFNGTIGAGNIELEQWQDGNTYDECTGVSHIIPSDGGLQNGLNYFARVTAVNSLGYSLPQAAPNSEKPQTVPGRPTAVVLTTISATQLRVQFSSPTDDGGDAVTSYLIEYASSSDFTINYGTASVTYLDSGSPYWKTLSNLEQGTNYYVQVRACNSQGCGEAQMSATTAAPYEESSAPSNVRIGVTSDSMLTVGYDTPTDNGGAEIQYYRVEWDTMPNFNSLSASPHKGAVDVDASIALSYTIDELSVATRYYIRVIPINLAGYGAASATLSAMPALQIPGIPRSITVSPSSAGAIDVSWLYPRIPYHGIPCGGFDTNPDECPVALGGSLPESTGGSAILEYEVEINERAAFDGTDGLTVTTTSTSLTISGLTEGRGYYVRVLTRNAVGSGQFCALSGSVCTGDVLYAVATVET
mmetsp:Transcript_17104/g.25787  ORF Transcript_17104/g.25787 Transcript_17104/m.25787 type:complete len:1105 (-) Transcript_17104:239-3553(-)